jgi:hypothetical protein
MLLTFTTSLTTSQLILIAIACGLSLYLIFHVAREIFFAANPDRRPIKRKRK